MYDVIVVGQGPAGATASYHLARKGLKVLGLDKATFPRYKPCGGCISKKAESILGFDVTEALEDTVYGATLTYRYERALEIISDRPIAANTRRERFDHLLVKKAQAAGAEVLEGRRVVGAEGLDESAKGPVTVRCETGEAFNARVLILADGAAGMTTRDHFGTGPRESLLAITAEVPHEGARELSGKIFIDFGCVPHGYAWIFPKKNLLSIGVAGDSWNSGVDIKKIFNEFVSKHYILKDLEIGKTNAWTLPVHFSGDGGPAVASGRALLIGDACGLVDRFLGEGIYYAVRSGQIAASVIHDSLASEEPDLSPYVLELNRELSSDLAASTRLSSIIYGNPRLWYRILERDPQLMHRYFEVIRGNDSYADLCAWISRKIKSRPLKFIERWIESKFLPS